jgi:hypothetical protein
MDKELVNSINSFFITRNIEYQFLSAELADSLVQNIVTKYSFDVSQRYLWESKDSGFRTDYTDDGNLSISELLYKFNEKIYLAITDDEFFPWPVFFIPKVFLIDLLKEHQYFEFFFFDESMGSVLFDTHDNTLLLFVQPNLQSL